MASSFIAYVDEAGCEGFKFGGGSSLWFVLSAVVTRRESDIATVKVIDTVRAALQKPPKKPLHFRDLKHDQKVYYTMNI